MKKNNIEDLLSRIKAAFSGDALILKYSKEQLPLRSELYSTDQLGQYALTLARQHKAIKTKGPDQLLKRLEENGDILLEVRSLLAETIKTNRPIAPAGEWLLDNFYLIEEQVRTAKKHLPEKYSVELPRLTEGESRGLPRVYDIALEIIAHSDGRVDLKNLNTFISSYQSISQLNLGELWAIPIMLRLALIENLRRVTVKIAIDRANQNTANYWADMMIVTAQKDPKSLILVIADMARSNPPMVGSFVAELTRHLQGKGPDLALPLTWMEQRLTEAGTNSNELVHLENQMQAADQVSISNSIGSLRFLNKTDWRSFVENASVVEQTLRNDIDGIYTAMDFQTRDQYRHVVERIAKKSSLTENEVANLAIQLAHEASLKEEKASVKTHVGYYLTGKGLTKTEKSAGMRLSFVEQFERFAKRFNLLIYSGAIALINTVLCLIFINNTFVSLPYLIVLIVLLIVCVSQTAIAIVNWLSTLLVRPDLLPRMDYSEGIPVQSSTLVVVPTLLTSEREIENIVDALEVRFLANQDANLHFGLLTDFKDANQEVLPEDSRLLAAAEKRVEQLNLKYGADKTIQFFLFHRPRKWNPADKIWMGYERKRGKLADLNQLILENIKDNFSLIVGDQSYLPGIKYVITLDTDTQLPRDAAWKLVGTMAHPLNKAVYNEKKQRVTEGYTILQPRVAVSMPLADSSIYERLHSNDSGLDPYTHVTSDVYQDLFKEGSFIGKGIYDVAAFEQAIKGHFPENRILSHDLLEGCYARAGLISDVQLYEQNPSRYNVDMKRHHRWIRGDWQIAAWCLPFVNDANKRLRKNTLSHLSRWKIFDNIRRSFVPIAFTLLLLYSYFVIGNANQWTLLVIALLTFPSFLNTVWDLVNKPKNLLFSQHIAAVGKSASINGLQILLSLLCLPYQAYFTLNAIIVTGWRMLVTHKKMLEWTPFRQKSHAKDTLRASFSTMWVGPFIGCAGLIYLIIFSPVSLIVAGPLLILWILSPYITWHISNLQEKQETVLSSTQKLFLQKLARKTWAFFERFVGAEDNWLPPDNYQEQSVNEVAHRTSPTNIGLSLLANLTAFDFGYITMAKMLERTASTIDTMEVLERHRGHFYNWYDTVSLRPLPPRYISTVDSGNLAGHLLTLRQGIISLPKQKIISASFFQGLHDTLALLKDTGAENVAIDKFKIIVNDALQQQPLLLNNTRDYIDQLIACTDEIAGYLPILEDSDAAYWAISLATQCREAKNEIIGLAPWLLHKSPTTKFDHVVKNWVVPTLEELANLENRLLTEIAALHTPENTTEENDWLNELIEQVKKGSERAKERIRSIELLSVKCFELADMEYDFLYDRTQHLLTIGYNIEEQRKDNSYYDLLASEARLCSFVAIAQGKIPQDNWFALGRLLTKAGGQPILLSWSGSMFEYLMPMLVMPTYKNTLLDQTNNASVARQIEYGKQRNVLWGISESGYNMVDANLIYQYRAFGVPGLGLKRGLGEDLVIAPYATMLALMVAPDAASRNLEQLAEAGFMGRYGFYEAIDYTSSRLPRGQSFSIVKSYMVHHQGMGFLSLAYLLLDKPMQKRFESELQFQATLLLLQERIPKESAYYSHTTEIADVTPESGEGAIRIISTPDTATPEVQLLSNGRYHAMITNAGGGYSSWRGMALTRWREDSTCDNWGTFCYIRDMDNGNFWSTSYQPTQKKAKHYEAVFSQARAEFHRMDDSIETYTEVLVSPEDDIEMRRVSITNRSRVRRTIEITSYAEVVMSAAIADNVHPAFSNLFVQTEIIPGRDAILCTRRPRAADEKAPWMFHIMKKHGHYDGVITYETDRMKFIGRGNTIAEPEAMKSNTPLSGTEGPVLDPIVAIRYQVTIEPGQKVKFDLVVGVSDDRNTSLSLIDKYQDRFLADRVFELAWTHSQVVLRQINASEADAQFYGRLAGSILYTNPLLRADANILVQNRQRQSGLWSYSISGDLPIVLLKIADPANINLVKQLVQAHAYWRLKGLAIDLVIWNEDHGGYRQVLQDQILSLITAGAGGNISDQPGGIYVRPADQITNEDRILFQTVARVVISDSKGTLAEQINKKAIVKLPTADLLPTQLNLPSPTSVTIPKDLLFYNGTGGFSPDGKEYIIITGDGKTTPAPWVNVLANPDFGTVISESGQAYTWVENAHEQRLTPWNNDPVTDSSGEAFYLRDEETGHVWSAMPLPAKGSSPYITRHGFGYSVFEHSEYGIYSEVWVFVDISKTIKYTRLKIRNDSGTQRKVSVTGYVEWVLGELRAKSLLHTITELDNNTGAVFARNPYNTDFSSKTAFFDVDDIWRTVTGDRTEFIGRNGSLRNPEAMKKIKLSNKLGAAYDPCTAIRVVLNIGTGKEEEVVYRLGAGKDVNDARNLVLSSRGLNAAHQALENVTNYWKETLGNLQVQTPDKALNFLANGWLLYQTMVARVWARSGFYQSGGAFGFRDQLQDAMAIVYSKPQISRSQILLCASRQFVEGDVQHWWHPPAGRGVRTRCSDDFLWLPFVTAKYLAVTGDRAILDEPVSFLEGRLLNMDEESYYDLPNRSAQRANLYNHCVRAITMGFRYGEHGLPLIGSGDWNDGMNMVGIHGKGESIWLGFFLYDILQKFIPIAEECADETFAEKCRSEAAILKSNLDKNGWDGEWYRRAYFDDGTPVGSAQNPECRIDAIAQSWSVLSGGGDKEKSIKGMAAVDEYLVRRDIDLIQLLDPPFDKSDMNPGYIKGYVPGVRENGGQYTHAAIWTVMAFAALGDKTRTWELMQMINPINHGLSEKSVDIYKVEPYVIAADIYASPSHLGRGGWTWYTGSAGWMYQLIIQSFLGLKLDNGALKFAPVVPADWDSFTVTYKHTNRVYNLTVKQDKDGKVILLQDDKEVKDGMLQLNG